jgi:hypothetical protein
VWPSTGWSTKYNCICILVLVTLRIATWVAETCPWILCNKITFIHPSAFFWSSQTLLRVISSIYSTYKHPVPCFCFIFTKKISRSEFGKINFFHRIWSPRVDVSLWKFKWDWVSLSTAGYWKCSKYIAIRLQGSYVETVIALRARLIMFSIKIFNLTEQCITRTENYKSILFLGTRLSFAVG